MSSLQLKSLFFPGSVNLMTFDVGGREESEFKLFVSLFWRIDQSRFHWYILRRYFAHRCFLAILVKVLNWKKYSFNLISNRLTGEFSPIAWDLSFRLHKDRVLCSILKGLSLISVYLFWRYCTPRFYWELSTCQKIVKSYSYWW